RPSVDRLAPHADVVFSPNYLLLPTRKPLVVTVHDLFFFDGEARDWRSGRFLQAHLQRHLERRAALVLTDSNAVRSGVLSRFPRLEGRVEVLYPGLRPRYRSRADAKVVAAVRARLDVPEEYLICVGELTVRKNQLVLIEALRRSSAGKLPPLVLCGMSEE